MDLEQFINTKNSSKDEAAKLSEKAAITATAAAQKMADSERDKLSVKLSTAVMNKELKSDSDRELLIGVCPEKLLWLADENNARSFLQARLGIVGLFEAIESGTQKLHDSMEGKTSRDFDEQGRLPIAMSWLNKNERDALRVDLPQMISSALEKLNGIGRFAFSLATIQAGMTAHQKGEEFSVEKFEDRIFIANKEWQTVIENAVKFLQFQERYGDLIQGASKGATK